MSDLTHMNLDTIDTLSQASSNDDDGHALPEDSHPHPPGTAPKASQAPPLAQTDVTPKVSARKADSFFRPTLSTQVEVSSPAERGDAEAEPADLTRKLQRLEAKLAEKDKEVSAKTEEMKAASIRAATSDKKLAKAEARLVEVERELAALREEVLDLRGVDQQVGVLKRQLETAKKGRADDREKEMTALMEEMKQKYQKEVEGLRTERDGALERAEVAEEERGAMEAQIAELTARLDERDRASVVGGEEASNLREELRRKTDLAAQLKAQSDKVGGGGGRLTVAAIGADQAAGRGDPGLAEASGG
jgi:DNA repair exonuclease SbcCD ATPase subunit